MSTVSQALKRKARKAAKPKQSVWEGPNGEGPNGGITQSLLSRFTVCRERFRLLVTEGLTPAQSFNHRMEYGQLWHAAEEEFARTRNEDDWCRAVIDYAKGLIKRHPLNQEQIVRLQRAVRELFSIYLEYWSKHPDVKTRTPLLQEQVFDVPYKLPSGRVVRLRGKWDGVDLIGKGKSAGVYLLEHKTKGDLREEQLRTQLASGFDLQTMLYLVALEQDGGRFDDGTLDKYDAKLRGVRYNVVRRPFAGVGPSKPLKGTKKTGPETEDQFIARLGSAVSAEPEKWFMRWRVEVTPADLERFRRECLDPLLEQLWDWWEVTEHGANPWSGAARHCHWRAPTGVYNPLLEGGSSELDAYLNDGSVLGLARTDTLFRELK